jgi:hypothetical protein
MALTPEDKADVKGAMGKAIANKVSNVTKDRYIHVVGMGHGIVKKPENMQRNPVLSPKSTALSSKSGGHKQGEREVRSKKAGFYVHGHKNYGDAYEA